MFSPPEKTILSVAAYAEGRAAMSHLLRQAGFRVLEAASADEALKQLTARQSQLNLPQLSLPQLSLPQLILLEVALPGLSGNRYCEAR